MQNTTEKKRIILLVRVSTKEQQEKGFSLPTQENLLRKYFFNYEIVHVIYDNTSGMKRDREAITKLRSMLSETDFVGALDIDRVSRDPKVMGVIEYWCEQANVKILTVDNPDQDELVSDIKSVVAKNENKKRIERILRTKDHCFANGRHIAKPPFGYFYDKNTKPSTLKKDSNISVIQRIFELRKQGFGYYKISKELHVKSFITIRNILRNPFYCGYIVYKGKINKGIHESVVSVEDFCQVNKIKTVEELFGKKIIDKNE